MSRPGVAASTDMCGIAGTVVADGSSAPARAIRRMTDIIAHRGPDGDGFYENDGVAFSHRRLSIIDLATGSQPMTNEDGSLWITYNGEIFNHADLRPELERAGHRYHSRCDTETILHAYEQYGDRVRTPLPRHVRLRHLGPETPARCSARVTGWASSPSITFGTAGLFAFASEIKALLEHPEISAQLNEQPASPSIWPSATAAVRRRCSPAFES